VQISTTAFVKQLESKGITIAEISLTTGLDEATVKFLLD
jgi:lambda repressor-like predicted transcriptional regulator